MSQLSHAGLLDRLCLCFAAPWFSHGFHIDADRNYAISFSILPTCTINISLWKVVQAEMPSR